MFVFGALLVKENIDDHLHFKKWEGDIKQRNVINKIHSLTVLWDL